jgi:DNA-binding GntR family transcriptional regulator
MSGNPYLEKYILQSYWRLPALRFLLRAPSSSTGSTPPRIPNPLLRYSIAEHNEILEALRNRDGQRARNAMEKHVLSTYKWLTNSRR